MILKEAALALKRSPLLEFMSAVTLGLALAITAFFVLLTWKVDGALQLAKSQVALEAFFKPEVATQDAQLATDTKIRHFKEVATVRFISKEQALQDYSKSSGEDVQGILGQNPLPASVVITLKDPNAASGESLRKSLQSVEGIEDVHFDAGVTQQLESRRKLLGTLTWLVGGLLLLTSLAFSTSIVRSSVYSRRSTITTMHWLGATDSQIRAPYLIEGVLTGLAGGVVGCLLYWLLGELVLPYLETGSILITPWDNMEEIIACAAVVAGGLIIGSLASILSTLRIASVPAQASV